MKPKSPTYFDLSPKELCMVMDNEWDLQLRFSGRSVPDTENFKLKVGKKRKTTPFIRFKEVNDEFLEEAQNRGRQYYLRVYPRHEESWLDIRVRRHSLHVMPEVEISTKRNDQTGLIYPTGKRKKLTKRYPNIREDAIHKIRGESLTANLGI